MSGDLTYTFGRGLRLGNTGLTLGGYTAVNAERDEGRPGVLKIDDLSFFVIADPSPRLHFFSELELEDLLEVDSDGRTGRPGGRFSVERLYLDLDLSDRLDLRGGVYLVPVGRWNVIHAAPLVWTTSRPLVTEKPFDSHTTGVAVSGSWFPRGAVLTYTLFGQLAPPIEGNPGFVPARRGAGARLEYTSTAGLSVGSTFLAARREPGWRYLGGLDLLWVGGPVELMGEFAYDDGPGGQPQWGAYLQGAFNLLPRLYQVDRYEYFSPATSDPPVHLFSVGLAFKPLPPMILKAEYLIADRLAPEASPGFKASFAFLF